MSTNEHYPTSDFNICVALGSIGFQVDSIEKRSDRHIFYIKRSEGLDEALQRYFTKQLLIEPQTYEMTRKVLKSRLNQS